ncbi:hypothetical protein ITK37_004639 [Salmonella enterica]|nr:hypothetical protein [Salmonella enterica]EBS0892524.1 hypothetical protein [Salmonella enterica subsp. enterica serovar Abaetetuba]EHA9227486.1 hypothetical protein [Salmonella enterica subsp. enterica serovar Glostrup]EBP2220308.1 hypothetical protein [Salmonella enterica]ECC6794392.1 hypothetical protein [Salmonella enterica]
MRNTRLLQILVVPGILLALSGSAVATELSAAEQVYGSALNQCRTELTLLKSLNLPLYQQEEKALNGDLASAAQYLLMRNRLNPAMQETLDRLHQANLTRTCQQIHNALFNQLLNKSAIAVSPGGKGV